MTPKQLTEATDKELVIFYKNKARCFHSKRKADAIFKELELRLGVYRLQGLSIEANHIELGESDAMFDVECDKLINSL
jgi:adenine-specific DNA methylase